MKQIRYFIAVAETEKVSAAAAELGISQSAVTIAVQELEANLGVPLFERTVRGVALTKDGQNFLSHAKHIQASVADAMHSMQRKDIQISGHIRLGVTYTGAGYFLFPVLARFRRAHPSITVQVFEAERHALEKALLNGKMDLALMVVSNLSEGVGLSSRTLVRSPRVLWLSGTHRLIKAQNLSIADIATEAYVQFTADDAEHSARRFCESAGFRPNIVLRTTSLEAVRAIVATDAAVTILAHLVFRPWSLDGGRVEFRPLKENISTFDLGLVWKSKKSFSESERKLVEYFEETAETFPHRKSPFHGVRRSS